MCSHLYVIVWVTLSIYIIYISSADKERVPYDGVPLVEAFLLETYACMYVCTFIHTNLHTNCMFEYTIQLA